MRGWAVVVSALALIATAAAGAAEGSAVQAVADGQTLTLADGRTVRLAAVAVPGADVPVRGAAARIAETARQRLAALVAAGPVALEAARTDRWGRVSAQVRAGDGTWLQHALVADGLACVATTPDDAAVAAALYRDEGDARAARRGLWALEAYRVRGPAEAAGALDRFAIVEGVVREVRTVSGRALLLFDDGGERGFTVTVAPGNVPRFRSAGVAPMSYRGRRVRVRGWVREFRGPQIEATHPAQIEVVAP
jgi:endonuclease YncB( thermonuclease family)